MNHPSKKAAPKIFLFGTGHTGYIALSYLLTQDVNIVGVCSNTQVNQTSLLFKIKVFIVQTFYDLGFKAPHDHILHSFESVAPDPMSLARSLNIPCYDLVTLKSAEFLRHLQEAKPDIILCFGFPKLLPKAIIDTATISSINIHPGRLPERGGGTPLRWAIYLGDKNISLTAHVMTSEFDAGKIIATQSIPLLENDNSVSAEIKLNKKFPDLMNELLALYQADALEKNVENVVPPQILPPMRKNHNQINWHNHSAIDIKRISLAMKPRGSAYTYISGEQVYFWDVSVLQESKTTHKPGTISRFCKNGDIVIQTIDGCLVVHSFLFGYRLRSSKFMQRRLSIKKDMFFSYVEAAGSVKA